MDTPTSRALARMPIFEALTLTQGAPKSCSRSAATRSAKVSTRRKSPEAARARMEATERAKEEAASRAEENAALLTKTVLTIPQQAGDDGRLFGSVTTQDIVDAIRDARGVRIDKRKVHLDEPIRNVGTHMVVVEVADGVTATVKTMVVASD